MKPSPARTPRPSSPALLHVTYFTRVKMIKICKNGKDFWDTVKPLLSTKNRGTDCDLVLKEDGNIVNVQNQVCKLFNKYYVSAASAIGQQILYHPDVHLEEVFEKHKVHPSVKYIRYEYGEYF